MNLTKIRTAFILGAGLGMRLRPLTEECPKPLLPVGGRPLITYAMDHCLTAGVERFIVNTHHCPTAFDRVFPEKRWRGRPILLSHEPVLLDTAGGMKNIEGLLAEEDETLLVYNGDILCDLPLARLLETHAAGGKEVTLVLRSDGPQKNVALDEEGAVCDLRGILRNPGVRLCLFTGIYAVEKSFFRRLTPGKVESVVPVLVEMIRETPGSVGSVVVDEGGWRDIGDPEVYQWVKTTVPRLSYNRDGGGPPPAVDGSVGGWEGEAAVFVRTTLGLPKDIEPDLVPVGRGGSDRDYFRVTTAGRDPVILMRYGRLREENTAYAAIAGFLRGIGVAVPEILGHDPERGLLLMEDLGDEDLFTCRNASWDLRRLLYEKTLTMISRLHAYPPARVSSPGHPPDARLRSGALPLGEGLLSGGVRHEDLRHMPH